MATSDAGAHLVLQGATSGDMWLGIALSANADLSSVVEADGTYLTTPRVLIPSTGWAAPSGREVVALGPTEHGAALQDFSPQFIVWWDAPTGGSPLWARRVTDTTARTGDVVAVPAATIRLLYAGF